MPQFEYKGATITVYEPTNRRREIARKIAQKIADQDLSPASRSEFSNIVSYTKDVIDGWKPPRTDASKEELIEGLNYWLDHVEPDLTDKWMETIFPEPDPVTSPVPPGDNADPNS